MKDEDLIKIARRHARNFAQDDRERDQVASLTQVQVKTAALIAFRGPDTKASVDVYLDRESGEFITGSFTLGHD
jgi:chromosome segregation and condensation protein ScpB